MKYDYNLAWSNCVSIFVSTGKYGEIYKPVFFKSENKTPPEESEERKLVKKYTKVRALHHSQNISIMCSNASNTEKRKATITKKGLITKLDNLLLEK
ncbi:hypothetical protein CMI40_00410 [Candidatus Pacearchaeota archaeon]|jgi:hypothetical protein|nr:hypothetical protein [Candidatus Pacearchaeota archaeon]|tara:strand:- start:4027 stop:4317 length:291 start_codon:yes stop_codon:yes gene_type:complete